VFGIQRDQRDAGIPFAPVLAPSGLSTISKAAATRLAGLPRCVLATAYAPPSAGKAAMTWR
jgi:hypothetical protein